MIQQAQVVEGRFLHRDRLVQDIACFSESAANLENPTVAMNKRQMTQTPPSAQLVADVLK